MSSIYIVGAGPGDPELITVKALKAIQKADVLLYDRLVNPALLDEAKPSAARVFCGKFPGRHVMKQEEINELIVKLASKGKCVVRLKGGDPYVFGRGGEEADYAAQFGFSVEVIPGITAGIAAPAYAGIPVTHRGYGNSFAVVTGHQMAGKQETDWSKLACSVDTIVVYMGMKHLAHIAAELIRHGRSPDMMAAVIEQGTTERQRVVTAPLQHIASEAAKQRVGNPAVIVIGDVVNCRLHHQAMEQAAAY